MRFHVLYKPPEPIQSQSKPIDQENKLSKEEWHRTILAAFSWAFYNAGYLVFLSFAFLALVEIGVPTLNAAAALSVCSFLIMLTIPFGGFLADKFSLHYLVGSGGAGRHVNPPGSTYVPLEQRNTYLAKPEHNGTVDVVEIFGGESGVGKLCLRRRLRRGEILT